MIKELWILFICAGRWQLDGMMHAKKMGYKIIAIDADKNAEGFKIADKCFVVNIHDSEKIINIINCQNIELNGVICLVSDIGQKPTAIIREHFNLFGMSLEVANNMTNKELQRKELFGKKGVNIPKFLVIEDGADENVVERIIGFPCVVKPVDSAGSRGVSVIYQKGDLKGSILEAAIYSSNNRVIIEEYIDGTEYTIETFTHKFKTTVLLITEKGKIRKTLANELFSANLPTSEIHILNVFINRVFEILKYNFGAGHSEVIKRKSDGKFFLVESAGRGGGFKLSDILVPLASGYNINKACVVQAMGLNPAPIIFPEDNKVVLRFIPSKKGQIKTLKGFDQGIKTDNVEVGCFMEVGDEAEEAIVDNNRLGFIAIKGKILKEVLAIADKVEKKIEVKYVNN
jgi:biotin carboxylase